MKRLVKRLEKVEAEIARRESAQLDYAGVIPSLLESLSSSDRALIEKAHAREGDSDCPSDLRAVWARWVSVVETATQEGRVPFTMTPTDPWL